MMKWVLVFLVGSCLFAPLLRAADDTAQQLQRAYAGLADVLPTAQELVTDGRSDEANQKLLAAFPEKTRTPIQSLLLGNLLFHADPKASYALHKAAAAGMSGNYDAQLEWAMEQHRAGEYAGAAEGYSKASKLDPNNALLYGLWAECLIRMDKTADAIKTWEKSETAPNGTLEDLESMDCEVHMHETPDLERAELMKKTRGGDIQAATKLIQLDANFPRDWWNAGPNEKYLTRDLAVLKATQFADASRLSQLMCAAECGIATASEEAHDVRAILTKYGFLLDPAATLPTDGWAMSTMLAAAYEKELITKKDARAKWGPAVLDKAEKSSDAEYFNVAADLYLGTDKLSEIDQMGWDKTGDVRFAGSLLAGMDLRGKLKAGDPLLVKAIQQFPEDSIIARFEVRTAAEAKLPMHDVLVHAIKTEYSKFSFQGGLSERRSAAALEGYFKLLAAE